MSDKSAAARAGSAAAGEITPTLLLAPRHTPDSIAMWRAATAAGWPVERLAGWRLPPGLAGRELVFYGEPLLAAAIGPAGGIALLAPAEDWLVRLNDAYRKRHVEPATLADARRLAGPRFVKPVEDKSFEARVYGDGSELPPPEALPGATRVLIAEPVRWQIEWRSFVLDRKILTMCPYQRDGLLASADDGSWPATEKESSEARRFAEAVLADPRVELPPAVVLDVGLIAERGWAVVECNAAWGSGIYGCDAGAVLRCIRRACVRRNDLSAADLPWTTGLSRVQG